MKGFDKQAVKDRYFKVVDSLIGRGGSKRFSSQNELARAMGVRAQQLNSARKSDRYQISVQMLVGLQSVAGDVIDIAEILTGHPTDMDIIPAGMSLIKKESLEKIQAMNSLIHIEVREAIR